MEYNIDNNQLWQASAGRIHMGSVLALEPLRDQGLACRTVSQVHGGLIVDDAAWQAGVEADGMVTDEPATALVIRTADCVPVHMTNGKRIAMVHAGWRSVRAGIVEALCSFFPDGAEAMIGPCISGPNYEVNQDLYQDWALEQPLLMEYLTPSPTSQTHRFFDLGGMVRSLLQSRGHRVTVIPICTYDSALPSHRRTGGPERLHSYIVRY